MSSQPKNTDELCAYRGKLLRDMTREELIAALAEMARYTERMHQQHREDITYLGEIGSRTNRHR